MTTQPIESWKEEFNKRFWRHNRAAIRTDDVFGASRIAAMSDFEAFIESQLEKLIEDVNSHGLPEPMQAYMNKLEEKLRIKWLNN